jgi:predicted Rossmann fold flavoprotein
LVLFFKKEPLSFLGSGGRDLIHKADCGLIMDSADVVIVGAGAAGMMCALTAGRRGRRVLLLDHADEPGKKILISGGGRCNFTNLGTRAENFLSDNPHFAKSALSRYTPQDFLALVEAHGIAWHEKTLGQLFCDGSARAIVKMLLDECMAAGVSIRLQQRITAITKADRFTLKTEQAEFACESLVLATGGLSIPKLGATGFAYDLARQFGLPVIKPRPALVPFTVGADDLGRIRPLSGVSLPVRARCGRLAFDEAMLFTHRGLSGPAILQISSYWSEGEALAVDLLPHATPRILSERKRTRPKAGLRAILSDLLPSRLADALLPAALATGPIGEMQDAALDSLSTSLKAWPITPIGTEGFAKAEVTAGGIDTAALSSRTMESRVVPGLFAIGEAVDVTGWLGGYNFQWAWASGAVGGATC